MKTGKNSEDFQRMINSESKNMPWEGHCGHRLLCLQIPKNPQDIFMQNNKMSLRITLPYNHTSIILR